MIRLNPREDYEQQTVCDALERGGIGFFSVPNEGKRTAVTAARLQRSGMRRGAPDLVLLRLSPCNGKPTMIENKRKRGGRYSDEQIELHAEARREGWNVIAPPPGESAQWVLGQLRALGYSV